MTSCLRRISSITTKVDGSVVNSCITTCIDLALRSDDLLVPTDDRRVF